MNRLFLIFPIALFLFSTCKTAPDLPVEGPLAEALAETPVYSLPLPSLVFRDIEAEGPENLDLHFTLEIENPLPFEILAKINSWQVELNGKKAPTGFSLEHPEHIAHSTPLKLEMDIAALAGIGLAPEDDYEVKLILELELASPAMGDFPPLGLEVSGLAEFPGVQAPEFNITSIAILRAELVNTRFRVGLEIKNPNPFPVDLAALTYVLYGNELLWADGSERNIIRVAGKSTLHGNLFLITNFIDMRRDLLDQIIRLEDVNYRFT